MGRPKKRVRLLLVDDADRVLLIHARDKNDGQKTEWQLPGGKVKKGEPLKKAAIRELGEESGYTTDMMAGSVAGPVWVIPRKTRRGRREDHVYVAYLKRGQAPNPTELTRAERSNLLGSRWWTLQELRDTDAALRPRSMAALYGGLLAAGEPPHPVRPAA